MVDYKVELSFTLGRVDEQATADNVYFWARDAITQSPHFDDHTIRVYRLKVEKQGVK